ncbi:MAG: UDP-N-acetylmuramate:L-alanyl-gamma-D-glutamyl-meso-diaminopimelate ligase [Pseudomonadota bacterium]
MRVHLLGICGTFMGGLAMLARELGHDVSGSDAGIYPPMSDQLRAMGVQLIDGYSAADLPDGVDLFVIGNALSRGNEAVEAILDGQVPYASGPEWLRRYVLSGRHVIAVAGTHGKTTVSSLVAWLLEASGIDCGFLIGGVPENFGVSARLGSASCFVVEADEYDTAFFDKRSKFLSYLARTALINNLEFDHADIFDNLGAIQKQFHHFVRTVPASGKLICAANSQNIDETLAMGCWSRLESFGSDDECDWRLLDYDKDSDRLRVRTPSGVEVTGSTSLRGRHNALNSVAALALIDDVGIDAREAIRHLSAFKNVKRRLELKACVGGIEIYDDFAHHPTAIRETLSAVEANDSGGKTIAILEPRSNTMRQGVHRDTLKPALRAADWSLMLGTESLDWMKGLASDETFEVLNSVEQIIKRVLECAQSGDRIVIMSNGGFDDIHNRLITHLRDKFDEHN